MSVKIIPNTRIKRRQRRCAWTFKQAPIDGKIVIGEGERDQAPMLYIGEKVGQGKGFVEQDIAVDPLEGTGLCARGEEGSLCVLAASGKNKLLHAPDV